MLINLINPYYFIIKLRNFLFDYKLLKPKKLPFPVISVGNISCGGTGKTSLVKYLASQLSKYYKIGILLRGYKRKSKGYKIILKEGQIVSTLKEAGDEAYMLAHIFNGNPKVNVAVCEDRFFGGITLHKELGIEILLLDDGFQHRKLARNIDLVLLKKEDLSDTLLPFGKLREPLSSLYRASAIILTYQEVLPFEFNLLNKPLFKLFRKNWRIIGKNGKRLASMEGIKFIAFCGLGDNLQFKMLLTQLKIPIKAFLSLPDHYEYLNFEFSPKELYLTTFKDYIKLKPLPNLYYLDFDIEIEDLYNFLIKKLSKKI